MIKYLFPLLFLFGCSHPETKIKVINNSQDTVVVYLTLGATDGCLQNVSDVPFVTDSLGSLVGFFTMLPNDSTIEYAPEGMGFNGNFTFNTQPMNCPTQQFPEGVNIFEFIINNGFQAGNPQETVDISCVAGVNSIIACSIKGGNKWNASPLYPDVKYFFNKGKYENSGQVGVFPFGCDKCTESVSPPSCDTLDIDKQKHPICNVQRNAKNSGGGLIRIIYNGEAPEPMN